MKLKIQIVVSLIAAMLLFPAVSQAAGISLGFATWYTKWEPYWAQYKKQMQPVEFGMYSFIYPIPNDNPIEIKPNCMYGPVLSFHLPANISITTRFLYGQFTANKKDYYSGIFLTLDNIGLMRRYDADIMLRYGFMDLLYLKAGFKYVHINYKVLSLSESLIEYYMAARIEKNNKYNEYAPVIGLGVSIPAIKNILSIDIDAVFQYCFAMGYVRESIITRTELTSHITVIPPFSTLKNVKKLGAEANLNVVYHVPVIPMNLSVGFRYNMYKKLQKEAENKLKYEHQYGLTAMVDYRFDFSKKAIEASNDQDLKSGKDDTGI
ncbi:MAG TPA: hypothetical protein PLM53_20075 [Spirochaetota bacterium]|nr:hypothetical protein [Spirochaetota bacterium]HQF10468.1 hypothetical protein [Spirochaetota bacterium]HQH99392.1 hypothetical protein [Spirochaetota bacterium]HQJ72883.1 hypothetical protein [Spirochaetota bacterium]